MIRVRPTPTRLPTKDKLSRRLLTRRIPNRICERTMLAVNLAAQPTPQVADSVKLTSRVCRSQRNALAIYVENTVQHSTADNGKVVQY